MTTYCLRCKAHREIAEAEQVTMRNGRPQVRGKCGVCDARVSRIGKLQAEVVA